MALFDISANANLAANDFSTGKKDHGTVVYGGTVAGSKFQSKGLGEAKVRFGGAVVASGDGVTAVNEAAFLAGRFAQQTPGQYVIEGITSSLAGQTNNVLKSPGQNFENRKTQPFVKNVEGALRSDAMRREKFNHLTQKFDTGYPVADSSGVWDVKNSQVESSGTADHAAMNSYTDAPHVTFMIGAKTPSNKTLNQKTG